GGGAEGDAGAVVGHGRGVVLGLVAQAVAQPGDLDLDELAVGARHLGAGVVDDLGVVAGVAGERAHDATSLGGRPSSSRRTHASSVSAVCTRRRTAANGTWTVPSAMA